MRPAAWFPLMLLAVASALAQVPAPSTSPEFHSIYAVSKTVYLRDEPLRKALAACPELQRSGVLLAGSPEQAELLVEVHRPFLTFDWTYTVVQQGAVLASGKVVAFDGAEAAPKLAEQICAALYGSPETRTSRRREWRARYRQGSVANLQPNTPMRLVIAGAEWRGLASGTAQVFFAAPLTSVTAVANVPPPSASERWWSFWSSSEVAHAPVSEQFDAAVCGDEGFFLCLATAPAVVGVGQALKIFPADAQGVKINWVQDGVVHYGEFVMSPRDAKSLLKALRATIPTTFAP